MPPAKKQEDDVFEKAEKKPFLDHYGTKKLQMAAAACYMTLVSCGVTIGYSSPASESFLHHDAEFKSFKSKDVPWFGSLTTLGAIAGGLVAGPIAELFGRNPALCTAMLFHMAGWISITVAASLEGLFVGRIILGIGTGMATMAGPVYIAEISAPKHRGTLGAGIGFSISLGILLVYVGGHWLNWQLLGFASLLVSVLGLVVMSLSLESPVWLLKKQKYEEYGQTVEQLYGCGKQVIITEHCPHYDSLCPKELAKRSLWRALFLSLFLMALQQFSGIGAVIFYNSNIFKTSGLVMGPSVQAIVIAAIMVIVTFIVMAVIERCGRRKLMYLSGVIQLVGLLIFGAFYCLKAKHGLNSAHIDWVPLASLSIYVAGFALGYGPIPWLMMGEMLPMKTRAFTTALCTAFNWACTFVVTNQFQNMLTVLRPHGTYWLFAGVITIGIIVCSRYLPETGGKTLQQIEEDLEKAESSKSESSKPEK